MKESRTFRLLALAGFLAVVLLIYLGVLYDTQVVHHEEYLAQSLHSIAEVENIDASRGIITDRKGRPLVSNTSVYTLTFDTDLLDEDEDPNEAILRLLQLCRDEGYEWQDNLPISMDFPYPFTLDSQSNTQKSQFLAYLKSVDEFKTALTGYLLEHPQLAETPEESPTENEDAEISLESRGEALLKNLPLSAFTEEFLASAGITASDVMSTLQKQAELSDQLSQTEARWVLGVRYELALRKISGYSSCTLVENVDTDFISKTTDGKFSGAEITHSSIRKYETSYAAHILGTVGPLYAEDLTNPLYEDYPRDATVGKSGVESAFESYLRGTDGRRVISTNSEGKITGEYYSQEPRPGNTVELTIDLELQKAVEDALAETVTAMNEKDGLVERGAGAVVERIGTGEILALASYPTYDLSTFRQSEIWAELSSNPAKPFQNRATQGTYPPGSTFKMLTAAAALEEEVVGLKEEIRDTGKWYYPDIVEGTARWGYNCWNRGGHGLVDVVEAITVSCNYYFYEMGYRLGIDRLSEWAAKFGFGEPTGIEIGDASGILASREEREEKGGVWYGGDTVMAAIGQSDNLFTPIQLANYVSTLIAGGERYETRLLKAVKTYDNAEVVAVGDTKPVETIDLSESTLSAIKKGMYDLTTTGSLSYYFKDCIVPAGAKTGTAQLGENTTNNGMFVCFAPYDDPEIAVAVAIEKGGSGSALASTAVKILNAYFSADEIGTAIIPENQLLP